MNLSGKPKKVNGRRPNFAADLAAKVAEEAVKEAPKPTPKRSAPEVKLDRLPPSAIGAEQGVLGCILLSPNDCLGQCLEKLRAGSEVFYDLRHQAIYDAMVEMYSNREPIDVITLQQRLKDQKLLEEIGGIPYLNTLQDSVPSAANVTYYAEIVQEKYLLRKMIHACTSVVERIYEYKGEVDVLLDEVERDILAIGKDRQGTEEEADIKKLVQGSIGDFEKMFEAQGKITGITTGFGDLDRMTDGMHGGDMIVLAGYPSTGKTSFAMNVAEHVALVLKKPVAVFTLEMSPQSLTTRFICSSARVNIRDLKGGKFSESDFPKLTMASGKVSSANLHIVKASGWSVMRIRSKARSLKQKFGIEFAVVDYLQKANAQGVGYKTEKQSDVVAAVSNGLKDMAVELGIPVLVLSQLNDDGELFMSRVTGMDADSIYKLKVDRQSDEWKSGQGVPIDLLIEKQRNGPTGIVNLVFLRNLTRFESAAKVNSEENENATF